MLRCIGITVSSSSRFWVYGDQFNVDLYDFISFLIVSAAIPRGFSVDESCWYKFIFFCSSMNLIARSSRDKSQPSLFSSKVEEVQNSSFFSVSFFVDLSTVNPFSFMVRSMCDIKSVINASCFLYKNYFLIYFIKQVTVSSSAISYFTFELPLLF